jgi:radical SAM superfamily enzyme YgiQ (UPF0313 family)
MTLHPDAPFHTPLRPRVLPQAMREPPTLSRTPSRGMKKKHALLINPFYPKDPNASFGKHVLTPTLALTSVAAATPSDWTVEVFDENVLLGAPPSEFTPEVVGITVHLTFAERAYTLARYFRDRGAIVIFGGLHVLSCPEECAPHADALVMGDGVQAWPHVLRDVAQGTLKNRHEGNFQGPYADDPAPRRDLLPRDSFLTTTSLNATRGCHNRCGFCYLSTEGLQMPYRMRTPGQIAKEIEDDGQPYCVFTDNNLGSNRAYLRALCASLAPLGIIWSAAITIDVTDDPSLVRAMALSGCTGVFIGFESLTDENLADARKKTPRAAEYAQRIAILHDHGIQVNGSFVVGFDHDRKDCFATLAAWIEEVRMESATFHILTPYPGTPLFREMESQGRLLHRNWSEYDTAHAVFQPKHMTPEELEQGYGWLYQRTFSAASIWARRPNDVRAVPAYLAMSTLYKKSNALWHVLIERQLVHRVWSPIVEATRQRHLRYRRGLSAKFAEEADCFAPREETAMPRYIDLTQPASVRPVERVLRGIRSLSVLPAGV